MDAEFPKECERVRAEGNRLGAFWRLATESEYRSDPTVSIGLIKNIVAVFLAQGAKTALAVFNPRHERIYKRLLNFETIARSEGTEGLTNAPGVLMRLDADRLPSWCHSMPEGRTAKAEQDIRRVTRRVLARDVGDPSMRLREDLGAEWEHLLELIYELEQTLGVSFSDDEVNGMRTIGDVMRSVKEAILR